MFCNINKNNASYINLPLTGVIMYTSCTHLFHSKVTLFNWFECSRYALYAISRSTPVSSRRKGLSSSGKPWLALRILRSESGNHFFRYPFNFLLFRFGINHQHIFVIHHNKIVQSPDHCSFTLGQVNHAVAGLI